MEKECLAIKQAETAFRVYLLGKEVHCPNRSSIVGVVRPTVILDCAGRPWGFKHISIQARMYIGAYSVHAPPFSQCLGRGNTMNMINIL